MHKSLSSLLIASSVFGAGTQFEMAPTYGFRWDKYTVANYDEAVSDKAKYRQLGAVTAGLNMRLISEEAFYLGARGSYGHVVTQPKVKLFRNGRLTDDVSIDKKYALEADGVMGYQFHLNNGRILLCPQIGYGYAKYKLTNSLVAPSVQEASIGAFSVSNGGPYAGLKTVWFMGSWASFQMTTDYFYSAFRHESPLENPPGFVALRMLTYQGPRVELKWQAAFESGWFLNLSARGRYFFTGARKFRVFPDLSSEFERSSWLTLEGLFSFGYNY